MQVLMSWLPFLVLIVFWIGFMGYFRRSSAMIVRSEWFDQSLRHMERIEVLLERIAARLEQDGKK
jgi:hypothetical protein